MQARLTLTLEIHSGRRLQAALHSEPGADQHVPRMQPYHGEDGLEHLVDSRSHHHRRIASPPSDWSCGLARAQTALSSESCCPVWYRSTAWELLPQGCRGRLRTSSGPGGHVLMEGSPVHQTLAQRHASCVPCIRSTGGTSRYLRCAVSLSSLRPIRTDLFSGKCASKGKTTFASERVAQQDEHINEGATQMQDTGRKVEHWDVHQVP